MSMHGMKIASKVSQSELFLFNASVTLVVNDHPFIELRNV